MAANHIEVFVWENLRSLSKRKVAPFTSYVVREDVKTQKSRGFNSHNFECLLSAKTILILIGNKKEMKFECI